LELSGNDCSVEDLQHHAGYAYDSSQMEAGIGDESYTSDIAYNEPVLKSTSATKVKKERNSSKTKPPKIRQKKSSRHEDEDNGSVHDSDGGDGNGSLMKRRRKTELQISVSFHFLSTDAVPHLNKLSLLTG
jgi:hypothetical protein